MANSGFSALNIRVEGLEFVSSVVDFHPPGDAALSVVYGRLLGSDFVLQDLQFAESSTADKLARYAAEFIPRDVQQTAVFGCEAKVSSPNVIACSFGGKGFVEGTSVCVSNDWHDWYRLCDAHSLSNRPP